MPARITGPRTGPSAARPPARRAAHRTAAPSAPPGAPRTGRRFPHGHAMSAVLGRALRTARQRRDAGQAFPIYLTAVAGLLFLALAYFAVGQAGATRNEGQTAADAAALAAAQSHRDQLRTALLRAVLDGGAWEELLQGRGLGVGAACEEAVWFAGRNGADLTGPGCRPGYLPTSFTVTVRTRDTVGESVIPGTEDKHAEATARAVVKPLCVPDPVATPPAPGPGPSPSRAGEPAGEADGPGDRGRDEDGGKGKDEDGGKDKGKDEKAPLGLDCDGRSLTIDPEHPELFPEAKELFSVRLAE